MPRPAVESPRVTRTDQAAEHAISRARRGLKARCPVQRLPTYANGVRAEFGQAGVVNDQDGIPATQKVLCPVGNNSLQSHGPPELTTLQNAE